MKKFAFSLLALGLILVFTQCEPKAKEKEDTRTVITKKILYDVPLHNPNEDHDWWVKNIEGSDREALLNNIFAQVRSGEIQAYDYFNEPLSVNQVESLLSDTIHMVLQRPYDPYDEYDTTIYQVTLPSDFEILRFLEEWKYDEKTLQIDKKILGICPVMKVQRNGEWVTRPYFWVYFD